MSVWSLKKEATNGYERVAVQLLTLLPPVIDDVSGEFHAPCHSVYGGRATLTRWSVCWLGSGDGLDAVEKRKVLAHVVPSPKVFIVLCSVNTLI